MKTLILIASFAVVARAADDASRRLESVAWDPVKHQLQWVVSKGAMKEGQYKANAKQQYNINIDDATMTFSDETRRFSKQEAVSVRRLLDLLTRYAAESTIWWEEGQGEPVGAGGQRVSLPAPRCAPSAFGPVDLVQASWLTPSLATPLGTQDQDRADAGDKQKQP